jgi:hypothetical protein
VKFEYTAPSAASVSDTLPESAVTFTNVNCENVVMFTERAEEDAGGGRVVSVGRRQDE